MLSLIERSVYGGVLILVILAVRQLLMDRLPRTALSVLWIAAMVRLLAPLRLPFPASIYAVADPLYAVPARAGLLLSEAETAAEASPGVSPLWIVWLAGLALSALYFLYFHLRSRQGYRVALPVENPFIRDWMECHRLRRPVQVRYSDQIGSPLTYGVLWPVILLPKGLEQSEGQEVAFILAHEMAHVRRFDALTKWLFAAALCIHWFNPLVWLMYLLANRDLELTCDEAVVRQYGRESKTPYALTLVEMEERRTEFAPLASGFSKGALQERITSIMRSHPATAAGIGAALLLVATVVVVFATTAPQSAPKTPVRPVVVPDLVQSVVKSDVETAVWPEDGYTREQYDRVLKALYQDGYEELSIARFNRSVNAALTEDQTGQMQYQYEIVMGFLPATDPMADFLCNTVQASLREYYARAQEVYTGERGDPEFWGQAEAAVQKEVLGKRVEAQVFAQYSFTYRILDQDLLTVRERDAFLQAVMQAAQDTLGAEAERGGDEQAYQAALETAGAKVSNSKIEFTGCKVESVDVAGML